MNTNVRSKDKKVVRDTRAEALKIANSQHIEGQTKEQTRLIAKGIQRGIEQYLRQQSEKARDLDRRVKKVKQLAESTANLSSQTDAEAMPLSLSNPSSKLPWILLMISWCLFLVFWWMKL